MKELSIEEKAKRFDKSLEKARKLKDEYNDIEGYYPNQWLCEELFPELRESEDERIRKELLDFCKNRAEYYPNDPKYKNISAWIAWLEKQSKDSPVLSNSSNTGKSSWGEEDEKISNAIIKKLTGSSDALCVDLQSAIGWVENIKDRVQPKQEWNEDDALKIDFVSKLLTGLDQEKYDSQCMKELSSWLKSLKDRVQPKQEWSKEDRRHIEKLILNVNAKEFPDEVDWLISLHEKIAPPYWDKEDEEMLNQAIQEVEYALNDKNIAFSGREPVLLWLKHLRPKSQWKPDSSMLICLEYAIKHINKEGDKRILSKLLEQLKKLREE